MRSLIRRDIDTAMAGAYTTKGFWQELSRMGYTVKRGPRVKYTAVKPPGSQRFCRLDSLGTGYTEADILSRLSAVRTGEAPPSVSAPAVPWLGPGRRYRTHRGTVYKPRKLKGLRALYFKYLCLLGAVPKHRPGKRAPPVSRTEIIKFDRYQEQFLYLMRNRIETAEHAV